MGAVIARRYGRRDILKGSLAVTAATALFGTAALQSASGPAKAASAGFAFRELAGGVDETHHVAEGYDADVVIRWGDPLVQGHAAVRPRHADRPRSRPSGSATTTTTSPSSRSTGATRAALLCVNNEYANPEVMFPGLDRAARSRRLRQDHRGARRRWRWRRTASASSRSRSKAANGRRWSAASYNRRITADTPMTVDGPAAGHDRLKTKADPDRAQARWAPSTTAPAARRRGAPT